jgi:hypothetical protein
VLKSAIHCRNLSELLKSEEYVHTSVSNILRGRDSHVWWDEGIANSQAIRPSYTSDPSHYRWTKSQDLINSRVEMPELRKAIHIIDVKVRDLILYYARVLGILRKVPPCCNQSTPDCVTVRRNAILLLALWGRNDGPYLPAITAVMILPFKRNDRLSSVSCSELL